MERGKKKLPVDHRSLAPSVSLIPLRLALTLKHSALSRNFLLFFHYSGWFEFLLISSCFLFPPNRFFLHKTAENYFSNFNKHVSKQISSLFRLFCFLPHIQSLTQMSSSRMVIYFLLNGRSGRGKSYWIFFTSLLRHPLESLSPDFAKLRSKFRATFAVITLEIDQSSTWSIFQIDFS